MNFENRQSYIHLALWIAGIYLLAAIAGIGSLTAPEAYLSFTKPSWAPPASIFGPVWSALYTMIAISGWLVWRTFGFDQARVAFMLFFAQIFTNVLWSWFFFSWQSGFYALLNITLMLVLLIATLTAFWRLKAFLAAGLLVPYLVWISFAAYLNFSIWKLNPTLLGT
jgi:benzodiazapine receptor